MMFININDAHAQQISSMRKVIQPFSKNSSVYLGNWVIEESITVKKNNLQLDDTLWSFNPMSGFWALKNDSKIEFQETDSLIITYQSVLIFINRTYSNYQVVTDRSFLTDSSSEQVNRFESNVIGNQNSYGGELQQSGSLTRGFTVGSNQDFALESGLQFQLDGKLTEDVSISAALTDKSLPIQPDGSTQNLREFDRVFIQVESNAARLQMGDVDLRFQNTEFARINRRLQGANGQINSKYGDYTSALSVARGTFRREFFQGQDGLQGPYRLTGRNDRQFVTILAGSERVYINGREVVRGAENDYIIDYGIGEIYFTNNMLIKDESRINVEYQYLDQDFTRTLVAAEGREDGLLDGRLNVGVTFLREADGDNLLSQRALTADDINVLKNAGDNLGVAITSGADSVDLSANLNEVLYAKMDTLFNGQVYEIFKHLPGSPEAVFTVNFSRVESGNGSYQRVGGAVNGLLFEWVGPANGDYEPFRQLPAPLLQQMASIDSRFKVSDKIELYGEWAGSYTDLNRFSDIDDDDNTDIAYLSGISINDLPFATGTAALNVRRRFSGGNFSFFDRTRDIEFARQWNLSSFNQSEETLDEVQLSLSNRKVQSSLNYGALQRFGLDSKRQSLDLNTTSGSKLNLSYDQDFVQSKDEVISENANWFRNIATLEYHTTFLNNDFKPNFYYEQENRKQRDAQNDSLSNSSFSFLEIGPGFSYTINKLELGSRIIYRRDDLVNRNNLKKASEALEQNYFMNVRLSSYFRTEQQITLRNKTFTEDFEQLGNLNRRGILIRSNTRYQLKSEALSGSFFYETNTERRAILQESYIEVGPELGLFTWNDLNDDGVQQIDEFFPELTPNEGTFIRQFLPSDQLLPIITLNLRLQNEISPFKTLSSKWLQQLRLNSRITVRESSTSDNLSDIYLLKVNSFRNDSTTIQGNLFIEKELDLFPDYDDVEMQLSFQDNRSLNQRSGEVQKLDSKYYRLNFEVRPLWRYGLILRSEYGFNKSISDRLINRNFDIDELNIEPGFNIIFNRSFSSTLTLTLSTKKDRLPAEEVSAQMQKIKLESRAFLFRKIQTNWKAEFRNVNLKNQSSSFGIFELTEGLGEGRNMIWGVNASYNASRLIRFTLNYDARTVSGSMPIHTGKFTISAIF